jgi:L-asparagine oxygenase
MTLATHATTPQPIPTSAVTHIPGYFTTPVPPTPLIFDAQHDACPTATVALTQFSDAIGRAVGYDREQGGRLIQDIFPVRSNEREQVSSSSKVVLGSHTETAFHPHRPRFVVLLCLRSEPQAATTYADVADIVVHLSNEHLAALQTNEFVTSIDTSFMSNGEPDAQVHVTPLTATGEGWSLIYDQLLMRGTTPRAIAALSALHDAVKHSTQQVVLAAGDILVIDNHRAVHGRTPFAPRYDGTDRWLKRALVVQSLDDIDAIGRVIQTRL